MSMADAPDYVRNFLKPPNTEIKQVGSHYYLYGCTYRYDKERKRSKKIPGEYLGSITPEGLVPPHTKIIVTRGLKTSDNVEIGASCFFYPRTEHMRLRLQKYFPELWERIYVTALLRAFYDGRFKRLRVNYDYSILSYVFPGLSFNSYAVTQFLRTLGMQRDAIVSYMREDLRESDRFLLFDGHRILTASKNTLNAEMGYDSKHRYKPQLNVLYVFSLDENAGRPVYYRQYNGGTPDVSAFSDIIKEAAVPDANITVLADKGSAGDENFKLLDENHIQYIIPLKRGNRYVSGKVPSALSGYDELFSYCGRAIHCITFPYKDEGILIHLFLDVTLMAEEAAAIAERTEKKDETIDNKVDSEMERHEKGRGKLSDTGLSDLQTISTDEAYSDKEEIGTITLKTNRTDLTARQCYCLYKQRKNIENFFDSYDNTLDFDASYLQNKVSEEAWLFLNHLSSMICIDTIEEIAQIGETKNISFKDLTSMLIKISTSRIDEHWEEPTIKKKDERILNKLNFDPRDLSVLPLK